MYKSVTEVVWELFNTVFLDTKANNSDVVNLFIAGVLETIAERFAGMQ